MVTTEKSRSFTKYSILLVFIGLAVNVALARLVLFLGIPLYLDSLGTIFASIAGGYLPGIIVGFCSNAINGISDPITLFYGIISILIAISASFFASRNWFAKLGTALCASLVFAFIGGVIGSCLTWLLYGFGVGSGISASFVAFLYDNFGFTPFASQLTADIIIDIADKLITVLLCFAALKLLPSDFLNKFSSADLYYKSNSDLSPHQEHGFFRKHSLRSEVVLLIALFAVILGCLATAISYILYRDTMVNHYIGTASSVADMALSLIDADSVDGYLSSGIEDAEYLETEALLKNLRDSIPDIEYLYVYQVREDGCHVVFDVDTPDLSGEPLGSLIPMEDDFLPYRDSLLSGKEIPPIVSNGSYGWLLTVYAPVFSSEGKCVAYAAADISMGDVVTDRAIFIIKMVSLLFGASIVIIVFALRFSERRIIDPINAMARAAEEFAYDREDLRLETTNRVQKLNIQTGDEIENLYGALRKTVTDVSDYISDIKNKSATISRMQENIIISFANMVENRDMNTGEHIRHTAYYVGVIAFELLREGKYTDIISTEYIDNIVRSAPLHDLGKIKISDTILNKPGKLTKEEFDQIKTHPIAGREILEEVVGSVCDTTYLSEAVNMAAYHHERWDGDGYPYGLCGEAIPLSARIMAVADVYDALISKRSYKDAIPADEAFAIISGESGTHFDPTVVAAFLSAKDAVISVSK